MSIDVGSLKINYIDLQPNNPHEMTRLIDKEMDTRLYILILESQVCFSLGVGYENLSPYKGYKSFYETGSEVMIFRGVKFLFSPGYWSSIYTFVLMGYLPPIELCRICQKIGMPAWETSRRIHCMEAIKKSYEAHILLTGKDIAGWEEKIQKLKDENEGGKYE